MRKWIVVSIRVLSLIGFICSAGFAWAYFMQAVGYAKLAYSVPKPNPIYRDIVPVVSAAQNGFIILASTFLLALVATFFMNRSKKVRDTNEGSIAGISPHQEPTGELLWNQYALHIDLYKFYLSTAVKITIFYYAITGAILSYYFASGYDGISQYALLLPFLFSAAIGVIFITGAVLNKYTRNDIISISHQLGLRVIPEVKILTIFLYSWGAIIFLTGIGILLLFYSSYSTAIPGAQ